MEGNRRERARLLRTVQDEVYAELERGVDTALEYIDQLASTSEERLTEIELDALRGCALIDGGTRMKDSSLVENGVHLFRQLVADYPERLDFEYNLANGLSSLAENVERSGSGWYLATYATRREARTLFHNVGNACSDTEIKSKSLTNKANLLAQSHRWFEAYDAYRSAVEIDHRNGIATSGAAKLLLRLARLGVGPKRVCEGVARRYVNLAEEFASDIAIYSTAGKKERVFISICG